MSKINVDTIANASGTNAITVDSSGNTTFSQTYPHIAVLHDEKAYGLSLIHI